MFKFASYYKTNILVSESSDFNEEDFFPDTAQEFLFRDKFFYLRRDKIWSYWRPEPFSVHCRSSVSVHSLQIILSISRQWPVWSTLEAKILGPAAVFKPRSSAWESYTYTLTTDLIPSLITRSNYLFIYKTGTHPFTKKYNLK